MQSISLYIRRSPYANFVLIPPHVCPFPARMHPGIPIFNNLAIFSNILHLFCGDSGTFAYGDPHVHNEIVCIWGLTQETHYIHQNLMLPHFLINKFILHMRKGGLDGTHVPFLHCCHLLLPLDVHVQPLLTASWRGQDKIILQQPDEEQMVYLTQS